ncbi:acyltransferase [Vibrio sp. S9_S30]|uniref:acyltransferase n=1 Tax=Vibrio sp. S9_S30 TaxID=2720226 RepID=UPI001680FCE0|nr:acyltransferase [Vibrio sp. S9_S30]MBD1559183.1 acyltransferase [Vibrio sp. S9_S30]
MFGYFLLIINVTLVILNSALCSIPIVLLALVKCLVPGQKWKTRVTQGANFFMWLWATLNGVILVISNRIEWRIEGGEGLKKEGWYLMISNHLSWTDIVVLCSVFKDRIPMPKFFLKQQLLYVPFVGMACWALDMPFMRRYSREYLIKHPEKRGQDLETTRRSCEKFRHLPTTVVNYVEGTRYTTEKLKKSRSPYRHLLAPKSGGIAYTLAAMGEQFDHIIDVTLAYPDNVDTPFKDMLMGKMKRIEVRIRLIPMTDEVRGDYFNDKPYKRQFQQWLWDIWQDKDELLKSIYQRK